MSDNTPKTPISCILPVKNGESFINFSIPNILENMRSNDQLIIIDDNSSDNSVSKIESFKDNRILLVSNPGSGLVSALNFGISISDFEYIARFDVDDLYPSDRLEKQRKLLSKDVVAIFSDYEFISNNLENMGLIPSSIFDAAVSISLVSGNRTAHSSVVFAKDAAIIAGGYRLEDFPAEDLSLWLRISRLGNIISIPETLLRYRLHANSISSQNRMNQLSKKNTILREIGISRDDIFRLKNNFLSILEAYNHIPKGNERKILLLKDLLYLNQCEKSLKKDILKMITQIAGRIILDRDSLSSFYTFYSDKKVRDSYRQAKR